MLRNTCSQVLHKFGFGDFKSLPRSTRNHLDHWYGCPRYASLFYRYTHGKQPWNMKMMIYERIPTKNPCSTCRAGGSSPSWWWWWWWWWWWRNGIFKGCSSVNTWNLSRLNSIWDLIWGPKDDIEKLYEGICLQWSRCLEMHQASGWQNTTTESIWSLFDFLKIIYYHDMIWYDLEYQCAGVCGWIIHRSRLWNWTPGWIYCKQP